MTAPIALTCGEPAGIGPEIALKAWEALRTTVPFFWIGKLYGVKTVFIEVIDRIDTRTLTARLVSPVTVLFVAQMPSQRQLFPGSHLIGRLL